MSMFSGKCDFCDEIEIFGLDHILNSDVYVGNSSDPLVLTCETDCIPYYPHVVSVAAYNVSEGKSVIHLTEKSWVDIEEERYGHMKIHDHYRNILQEEIDKYSL